MVLGLLAFLHMVLQIFFHQDLSLFECFRAGDITLSKFITFGFESVPLVFSDFKLIVEVVMLNPYLNIFLFAFGI